MENKNSQIWNDGKIRLLGGNYMQNKRRLLGDIIMKENKNSEF
jgi:hypothetical protein